MKPTGVVLARNEEANIVACLQSFAPHVDDLLLIDMESTDRTVELAHPLVTRILSHPLIPNFDSARNIAISEARQEWIWFLDADERVSPETGRLVSDTLRDHGHEFVALTIPFKTFFCGKWIEHCGWWPGYTMPRVLRRGHFRFGEELHSGVKFEGPELRVAPREDLAIEHFSYRSVEHYLEKLNRYTSGEALTRSSKGEGLDWRRGIREMIRDLWIYYERNQGGLDGYRGWVLSWLSGQYRWLTDAKLLDVVNPRDIEKAAVPRDLDEVFHVAQEELATIRRRSGQLKLPLAMHMRSPLFDPSGYADDGRTLVKALALLDRPSSAAEIHWNDSVSPQSPTDAALLKSMLRQNPQGPRITVTNCITTMCEPDPEAQFNILRTTFETDRIPEAWLESLAAYDQIWVCAEHNRRAFIRGGVAPERIRIVPQGIDTSIFSPEGRKLDLPAALHGRFVFLSVFDWQLRKGWDKLLRAYCQEFNPQDGTGLLLKISRLHGHSLESVIGQAQHVLQQFGQSLESRPDVVLFESLLAPSEMAALYRSAQAFVLASRGEGWGRPYLEAMACGVPVVGTLGSGNEGFMTLENSFLVKTDMVPVPEEAAQEIPVYRGHSWQEPREQVLRAAMRAVHDEPGLWMPRMERALADVQSKFCVPALAAVLQERLTEAESQLIVPPLQTASLGQLRIELEGELFAGHSFSNINEELVCHWKDDLRVALAVRRRQYNPVHDHQVPGANQLAASLGREFPDGPEVTIRHSFPPNWEKPAAGKWVHIQPWEFGALPDDWIAPLRDQVDEIWAPSQYVRDVYVSSGIPREKIQVIPWGIDPDMYQLGLPDRILPTGKSFRFLFVGGTLTRKGFDIALQAYLEEFSRDDDVCLVIKDVGTQTFYRYGNGQQQIFEAIADSKAPGIVYLDCEMTGGQRASLYAACQCLVAPYRGEGFGLPVLEAMACGLPPIVPRGGPTDDFVSDETGFLLPSTVVSCTHEWKLCKEGTQLSVKIDDVRRAMRQAYESREAAARKGAAASEFVRKNFTWKQSVERMTERAGLLARGNLSSWQPSRLYAADFRPLDLSACVVTKDSEALLPNCLARVKPFVKEILVADLGSQDRTQAIAGEYNARVLQAGDDNPAAAKAELAREAAGKWLLYLEPTTVISEAELEEAAALLATHPADSELDIRSPAQHLNGHSSLRLFQTASVRQSQPVAGPAVCEQKDATSSLKKTLDIALVTIGYNLPGATKGLIESATRDCPHRLSFLVFAHSRMPEKVSEHEELAKRPDVVLRNYGINRGLAKSWNEGILWGFENRHDVVLVVNEDVLFSPGDVARLAEAAYQWQDKFLVMGRCFHENENTWSSSEYGCFAFNRLALETLGAFDENFFPIYCEDSDYRRRAQLAGLTPGLCEETAIHHVGSASLRQPVVSTQNGRTYAANRAYYTRKWGGDAGYETFQRPFNDPRFSYYIDPLVCPAPYPGHNRRDQELVTI